MKDHNLFNPGKLILLNQRILVKVPKLDSKTEGGIYLTDEAHANEQREVIKGELISFAEDAFKDYIIKPEKGDIIYFHLYAGRVLFDEEGNIYRNMSPKDLTGFEKQN